MRLRKGGKRFSAFGLLAFLGLFALAQAMDPLDLLEGFFGSVLSGMGEALYASPPPPDPTLDACAREGYPTYLQVNRVGTTRSPFCPGQVEATARASGNWLVSVEGSPFGQQAAVTAQVQSGGITPLRVRYQYNPPEPLERGRNELWIRVDYDNGRTEICYSGACYPPEQVSDWQMKEWLEQAGGIIGNNVTQDGRSQTWWTDTSGRCWGDCP